ncbi:MAG: hypothetical protein ACXWQE_11130 [Bdellovibrionales bacterium]
MKLKAVLCVTAALTISAQAWAKAGVEGQKTTILNSLCRQGKLDDVAGIVNALNSSFGIQLHGDSGGSAPQGDLIASNGAGKYLIASMTAGDEFMIDEKSRASATQVTSEYDVIEFNKGKTISYEVDVLDYGYSLKSKGDGATICRIGKITAKTIEDSISESIIAMTSHRSIFENLKLQGQAENKLDKLIAAGKVKLSDSDLAFLKEILFRKNLDGSASKLSETLNSYSSLVAYDKDGLKAAEVNRQAIADEADEINRESLAKSIAEADQKDSQVIQSVRSLKMDFTALKNATLLLGSEVMGSRTVVTSNDIGDETSTYRPVDAKSIPFLKFIGDKRRLDLVISK